MKTTRVTYVFICTFNLVQYLLNLLQPIEWIMIIAVTEGMHLTWFMETVSVTVTLNISDFRLDFSVISEERRLGVFDFLVDQNFILLSQNWTIWLFTPSATRDCTGALIESAPNQQSLTVLFSSPHFSRTSSHWPFWVTFPIFPKLSKNFEETINKEEDKNVGEFIGTFISYPETLLHLLVLLKICMKVTKTLLSVFVFEVLI